MTDIQPFYHDYAYMHVARILLNSPFKEDRTGTGTYSCFGPQLHFDLLKGFPLLTTKKVSLKKIAVELEWFIRGRTDLRFLLERGVRIWSDWPMERYNSFLAKLGKKKVSKKEFEENVLNDESFSRYWGDLGPVYGKQWRNSNGVDQFSQALDLLRTNPDSRRILVDSWNPSEIHQMALPPCHMLFQFYSRKATEEEQEAYTAYNASMGNNVAPHERVLEMKMTQRSADWFLGVPYNIASYALLQHYVAHQVNMIPTNLYMSFGDAHLYDNHREQIMTQLQRDPEPSPGLYVRAPENNEETLFEYHLEGYHPHGFISAPVAV